MEKCDISCLIKYIIEHENIPYFDYDYSGIINKFIEIVKNDKNIISVSPPVTVIGNINGNLKSLKHIISINRPPYHSLLFLGSFVDRGNNSLCTIFLVMLLKIKYPNYINIIRGSHESKIINKVYSFEGECINFFGDSKIFKEITNTYKYLAIAATMETNDNKKILFIHGGLSPELEFLDKIHHIKRDINIPSEGLLCDITWSEPIIGDKESELKDKSDYYKISSQGLGYLFSIDVY